MGFVVSLPFLEAIAACWSVALRVADGNEVHIAKCFYWGVMTDHLRCPSSTINFRLEDIWSLLEDIY